MGKEFVRVKLNSSQDNIVKGFYLLITNGNTYSNKKNEFVVEKKSLDLLTKNKVKFEKLPLREHDSF